MDSTSNSHRDHPRLLPGGRVGEEIGYCTDFLRQRVFAPKPATFDLAAMKAVWNVNDPKPKYVLYRGLLEPVSGGRFQMHALRVVHARRLGE